jgi:hypothetical protein
MILTIFSYSFFAVGLLFSYWVWIHPLLRARPAFADFYARTDSIWAAFWLKINSIKTKLSAVLLMIASGLVSLHDFVAPIMLGIDWSPITSDVPSWVWPIGSFALGALFLWLRNLTAKTQEKEIDAIVAGATPAEAKVEAGLIPGVDEDEDDD